MGREVVAVTASAWRAAKQVVRDPSIQVRLLRYTPLRAASALIVSSTDLSRPLGLSVLKRVYGSGRSVALVGATAADAAQFKGLLGHPGQTPGIGNAPSVALFAVRKVSGNGRADFSTDVLPWSAVPAAPTASGSAGRGGLLNLTLPLTSAWLVRTFQATPTLRTPPPGTSPNNLLDLATSYESSSVNTDAQNDQVQVVNTVWDAPPRS